MHSLASCLNPHLETKGKEMNHEIQRSTSDEQTTIDDRILNALQKLRVRRCRPDFEHIVLFLRKDGYVDEDVVMAALERLTDCHSVIRVEYKGSVSYRDTGAWASASGLNLSEQLTYCSATVLNSRGVSAAVCAAVAALSGENSFVTTESIHEYFCSHSQLLTSTSPLSVVLDREVNAGNLARVGTLGFMRKQDSAGDQVAAKATVNRKEKRIKKAKKIFDPSDNADVCSDDGESTSGVAATTLENSTSSPQSACRLCGRERGRGVLLVCILCHTPFHLQCLGYSRELSATVQATPWVCMDCRACVVCQQLGGELIFCDLCDRAYHLRCHQPCVRKRPAGEWLCTSCRGRPVGRGRPFKGACLMTGKRRRLGEQRRDVDCVAPCTESQTRAESEEIVGEAALTADQLASCVPDVTDWSVAQVAEFVSECGFEQCAGQFRACHIDGPALKLLSKQDVVDYMGLKLGPAIKLYNYVRLLQRKPIDIS